MDCPEPGHVLDASVLVLNRFYMSIRIITVRRAFVLLYRDAAEVIDIEQGQYLNYDFESWCEVSRMMSEDPAAASAGSDHEWVKAPSTMIKVPRIVRLVRFDRTIQQTLRFNRRNLMARDDYCCQYCGKKYPTSQLSIDHVKPRSQGGDTSWENAVCSCLKCNTKKGSRTPSEARMKLLSKPKAPKTNPLIRLKLKDPRYASWKTFLPASESALEVS